MAEESIIHSKAQHYYNVFHHERDGWVGESDVYAWVGRTTQEFKLTPGTAPASALQKSLLEYWKRLFVPMDTDGDGVVSREEFLAGFVSLEDRPDDYARIVTPSAKVFVATADVDGDGELDKSEFKRLFQSSFALSDEDIDVSFADIDTDSSGSISTDELRAAIRVFHSSTDPNDRGHRLLGPLRS
ncbi:EF-hand domain-containing protein [Streptomyces sp. NBC_01306]|uniref:EF-hand domain-containing protein n=1 Tax=Streptomyces sp. NBC_01306 TaxID=2903819 RepID=UPI00225BC5FF|nr:EF-hand domain-containing protein [Streptomyces sp. NBC_01306]MCX4728354.1 EF-hand domain-containing protein [Streptomyces sp. NBC_01306]